MMSSIISEYFKHEIEKSKEIEICLEYANLQTTRNNGIFTIESIINGYKIWIKRSIEHSAELFYSEYPILTGCFEGIMQVVNNSKFITGLKEIDDDVVIFAEKCLSYFENVEINIETFYLALVYIDYYTDAMCQIHDVPCNGLNMSMNYSGNEISFETFIKQNQKNKSYIKPSLVKNQKTNNQNKKQSKKQSVYSIPLRLNYTTDITHKAFCEEPIIIGREKELNRLIDVLCKKNKNNPVLIGQPGVGKTALVYALAERIITGNINPKLQYSHILDLNILGTISGAKYRGDFEERIKTVMDGIKTLTRGGEKIILCIDEIHSIVGAGSAEGALDLATLLKPFLLDESIKIIGTSTFKDYRSIEADKALERRFDTIHMKEPSFDETVNILNGIKLSFEKFHRITITKKAINDVIYLSKRYIPERFLPDKAIDLLDEACSIKSNSWDKSKGDKVLTSEDICIAISNKKDIPIQKVQNAYDLMSLENELNAKVIGQKHVSSVLAAAVRRTKAGLNDENRPIASFMFVGPTGVGKTETAKVLADMVFSGKDNIIRFDMSEYMEEHTVSKLIGAPPGYVGHKEAGLLTEQVRRNPYSLVLLDEFEKAHPKITNILLQVLDEGCLTDAHGEHVNFKNTIIILTSNVGVKELTKKTVGFAEKQDKVKKDELINAVKKQFSPEFLNRLDEVIQFNSLSKKDIIEIAKLHIFSLKEKVRSLDIQLDISDEVIYEIAKIGYSEEYGAREIRRTIDRKIKNPLADLILQENASHIYVELINGEINVSTQKLVYI